LIIIVEINQPGYTPGFFVLLNQEKSLGLPIQYFINIYQKK